MNQATLIGNVVRDIEYRFTKTGKAVASFTLAINYKSGDRDLVDYVNIVAWGNMAESCEHVQKGDKLLVHGRINTRSYETQDGQKRYVTEVVASFVGAQLKAEKPKESTFDKYGKDIPDEEIPF